jgi:hypothetical protein
LIINKNRWFHLPQILIRADWGTNEASSVTAYVCVLFLGCEGMVRVRARDRVRVRVRRRGLYLMRKPFAVLMVLSNNFNPRSNFCGRCIPRCLYTMFFRVRVKVRVWVRVRFGVRNTGVAPNTSTIFLVLASATFASSCSSVSKKKGNGRIRKCDGKDDTKQIPSLNSCCHLATLVSSVSTAENVLRSPSLGTD